MADGLVYFRTVPRCQHCRRQALALGPGPVCCLDCALFAAAHGLDPDAEWWEIREEHDERDAR